MLPFLKVLKIALDYSRGLNVCFFVCLNADDKTYYTFLNLESDDYFEGFKYK